MPISTSQIEPKPVTGLWFYEALLRIRPSQVGHFVKTAVGIHRKVVSTSAGHRFWIDPVSVFGLHLMRSAVHEPEMTKLLHLLLRPADVFIDIGGNEGYFSVIASTLVAQGTVHCIEPQSRLQPVLRKHIELNSSTRVILHQIALTDHDGGNVRLFLRPSTNSGASSMFRHWKFGNKFEDVPATTLDSFFEKNALKRVRLIKVDCEGAEHSVVAGARKVLRQQRIDYIAMEYHPSICGQEKCGGVHEIIAAAGYSSTKAGTLCIYHLPGRERELEDLGNLKTE